MGPRISLPGHSVTASFAGSFLRGVLPSQFSLPISFRRFAISVSTWTLSPRPSTPKPAPPSPTKLHKHAHSTLLSSPCSPTNCKPTPPLLLKAPPSEHSRPPLMISPVHERNSRHMDWSSPPRRTRAVPALPPSSQTLPHHTNHRRSQTCFNRPTPPSRTTPQKHGTDHPSNNG